MCLKQYKSFMDCIVFFPGVSSFLEIMARNRRITMLSITRKYNCSHFLQSEYLTNTRACFPVLPRTASPPFAHIKRSIGCWSEESQNKSKLTQFTNTSLQSAGCVSCPNNLLYKGLPSICIKVQMLRHLRSRCFFMKEERRGTVVIKEILNFVRAMTATFQVTQYFWERDH